MYLTVNRSKVKIDQGDAAYHRFLFSKYRRQILSYSSHIWFIKRCISENLQPNFVKAEFYPDSYVIKLNLRRWIVKKWLSLELRRWYGRKNTILKLSLYLHEKLAAEMNSDSFDDYLRDVHADGVRHCEDLRKRKFRKLNALLARAKRLPICEARPNTEEAWVLGSPHDKPYPRLVNETSITLSQEETALLEKGLKHALPPLSEDVAKTNILADLAIGVGLYSNTLSACANYVKSNPIMCATKKEHSIIQGLRKKIASNNGVVVKADKGNTVVLMERDTYDQKMMKFLESSGAIKVPQSKFNTHVRVTREYINASRYVLPRKRDRLATLVPNPHPPRIYGLPKLYKVGEPLRPIVLLFRPLLIF